MSTVRFTRVVWTRPFVCLCACIFMATLLLAESVETARAQFVPVAGGVDMPLFFKQDFTWVWPAAGATVGLARNGPNWGQGLGDAVVAGGRDLRVTGVHLIAPHAGEEAPGPAVTVALNGLFRLPGFFAMGATSAAQDNHGHHWDTVYATTVIFGMGFGAGFPHPIFTEGKHTSDRPCIKKFKQKTPTSLSMTTQPQYRDAAGNIVPGAMGSPTLAVTDVTYRELIPIELVGMSLCGFTTTAQGVGRSTTTVAYLGTVNGQPTQLDLGVASYLFSQYQHLPAPFFFEAGQDLHIAINMTQLLTANPQFQVGPYFQVGQSFTFQDGVCGDLPGVLIGRTPIQYSPQHGFQSAQPYSGSLMVQGEMGAELAPAVSGRITLAEFSIAPPPLTATIRPTTGQEEFDVVLMPATDGSYRIDGLPSGRYNMSVKGDRWLATRVPLDVPPLSPDGPVVTNLDLTLEPGDSNGDNTCDVFDLDQLIQSFNSCETDANYIPTTDFNGDTCTDVFDLDILIRHFNMQGDPE